AEVKPFQRFGGIDARAPHAQRQLLLRPPFEFVLQKTRQEVHIRPLSIDRLPLARLQRFDHARQAQPLELGAHLMHQFHAAPPNMWPSNSTAPRTKVRASGGAMGVGALCWSSPCVRMCLMVWWVGSAKVRAGA